MFKTTEQRGSSSSAAKKRRQKRLGFHNGLFFLAQKGLNSANIDFVETYKL